MISTRPLRRILEDYLEMDPSNIDVKVKLLLTSEVLNKYFVRVSFLKKDLIFDIDEVANEVNIFRFILFPT